MSTDDKLIRRSDVQNITGMTRYMIDILEEHGGFPKRMQVGHRAVFWSKAEVIAFIEQTKHQRGHCFTQAAEKSHTQNENGGPK